MFERKRKPPKSLNTHAPVTVGVPISPATVEARAKLQRARDEIYAAREALLPLPEQIEQAEAKLRAVAGARVTLEERHVKHAQGMEVLPPTSKELANAIAAHAKQAQETEATRQRIEAEQRRLNDTITRLTNAITELERAVATSEFQDALIAYREAIAPAIPLARAVRKAAAAIHRDCTREKTLLDPDGDYGRVLFGAYI